jgi:hypothetical protein
MGCRNIDFTCVRSVLSNFLLVISPFEFDIFYIVLYLCPSKSKCILKSFVPTARCRPSKLCKRIDGLFSNNFFFKDFFFSLFFSGCFVCWLCIKIDQDNFIADLLKHFNLLRVLKHVILEELVGFVMVANFIFQFTVHIAGVPR